MRLTDELQQAISAPGAKRMRGKIYSAEEGGLYIIETTSGQKHTAPRKAAYI